VADAPGGARPDPDAVDGDLALPSGRHEARERAMHLLYEAEAKALPPATVLDELPVAPDPFTTELVAGVGEHLDEVDGLVAGASRGWSLDRMPALDRAVLRLAAYELAHRPDVPTAVAIDEAVGLAKAYSTDDSGRFVNGVLSTIARQVRPSP
jgi:N utilization substance protein B